MKKHSRKKLAQAFVGLLETHSVSSTVRALADATQREGYTRDIDFLVQDIAAELLRQRGHLEAELTTAHPLPKKNIEAVTEWLKKITDARTVHVQMKEDPSLLGGAALRMPGREIDFSIKQKLSTLKSHA